MKRLSIHYYFVGLPIFSSRLKIIRIHPSAQNENKLTLCMCSFRISDSHNYFCTPSMLSYKMDIPTLKEEQKYNKKCRTNFTGK